MKKFAFAIMSMLTSCAALAGLIGRNDLKVSNDLFSADDLISGVKATKAQCVGEAHVWAEAAGEAECIRFYHADYSEGRYPGKALIYFSGDLLESGNKVTSTAVTSLRPSTLQEQVNTIARQLRVPFFMVARPGTYGSSGDHRQRRRPAEVALMNAAVDQLKVKYDISNVSLVGISSGGHVAAALISMRSDLQCATLVSAVSMPRLRWMRLGLSQDPTGYNDVLEPADLLTRATLSPDLHVVVVGDPADSNTPFATQLAFADKLKERGVRVKLVEGVATDPMRHRLTVPGHRQAARCMREVRDGIWTSESTKLQ